MNKFFEAVANVFRIPDLRRRILFTLAMLAVYRIGGHAVVAAAALAQQREHVDFLVLVMARRGLVEIAPDRSRAHLRFLVGTGALQVHAQPLQQRGKAPDTLVTRQPHPDRLVKAGIGTAKFDRRMSWSLPGLPHVGPPPAATDLARIRRIVP